MQNNEQNSSDMAASTPSAMEFEEELQRIRQTRQRVFAQANTALIELYQNEEGTHKGCPYVVMPDHFHALVRIPVGAGLVPAHVAPAHVAPAHVAPARSLGDVIGAFKSRQELGGGLRGIGNPALWSGEKLGVLCSRNAPKLGRLPAADVYIGGWHSPKEKEILDWLLNNGRRVIACPAWGIEDSAFAPGVRNALEENRMLILEMRDASGNLAAAEARNRFVIEPSCRELAEPVMMYANG